MSKADQKVDINRYKVIPRTLIFLFNDQRNVLLIKGSKGKKVWSGLLNGIGGHVESGEDVYEAAARELEEEAGLTGIPLNLCGQIMISIEEELGVGLFIFRGFYNEDLILPSDEGKTMWVPIDAIESEAVVEDLPVLIPKVYQFELGDPMIIGKYVYDREAKLRIFLR